jgi:hypothetical protein
MTHATIALVLLLSLLGSPAQNMAAFRANADAKLTNLFNRLDSRQVDFLAASNRYAQLVFNHATCPAVGDSETTGNNTNEAPTHGASWAAFAPLTSSLPARVRCDVYDGPQGKGWSLTAQVCVGTNVVERTMHSGPETWRAHYWRTNQ